MAVALLVRTILGMIGNVTTLLLLPTPSCLFKMCMKPAEDFKPLVWIVAVMTSIFWVSYGIITPNSTLVIPINIIRLFLSLCYLAIFMYYCKPQRCMILLWLGAMVVVAAVIAWIALQVMHSQRLVGVLSVLFELMLFSSPHTITQNVIDSKSVEFIPFWRTVACFSDSIIWAAYALIKISPTMCIDWYILTVHGMAAMLCASQFALYATYCRTPESQASKRDKAEERKLLSTKQSITMTKQCPSETRF